MANNKIIYGNQTLIDLTGDTVSADNLLSGVTAHDRSGTSITGNVIVTDDYVPASIGGTFGGNITIKPTSSGNGVLSLEGATSSNYGQLQLKRGSNIVNLTAADNLTADRNILFPNINGSVSIESSDFGSSVTGTSTDTYGTLIEKLRTDYFNTSLIRKNLLRVSSIDGQANMIFHCDRFQNQNTSTWTSLRGGSGGFVAIVMSFGAGSTAVRKYEWTTSGMTITALTNTDASGVTITII